MDNNFAETCNYNGSIDNAVMQNDNNLSNLTMSKSNVNYADALFRSEATPSIQFSPWMIEYVDEPKNETRCTIEEIDQPGSSLSADVSNTACDTEGPSRPNINVTSPIVFYNDNSRPWKLSTSTCRGTNQGLARIEKRSICPYTRRFFNPGAMTRRMNYVNLERLSRNFRESVSKSGLSFTSWSPSNLSENLFVQSSRGHRVYFAASTNNVEGIKRLLERGESPDNGIDKKGQTPLHIACEKGYTEIVSLLLKYGADVKRRNWIGSTPLHVAAMGHNLSIVTLLLSAGADPLSTNKVHRTPLQIANVNLTFERLCKNDDMQRIKAEVNDIVNVLLACEKNIQGAGQQLEALSNFCSRLSLSNTTDQV